MQHKQKAIIIGASSGIGLELAKTLSARGWTLGLAARRINTLQQLIPTLPNPAFATQLDITQPQTVPPAIDTLTAQLGGLDAVYICSGVDHFTPEIQWPQTANTIDTNVTGFAAAANHAFNTMSKTGGTITGITSIAALRGSPSHPAYCATKAFQTNYLEGLRAHAIKNKIPITITDARPGYIDTPMSAGQPGKFWELTPQQAAQIIHKHTTQKKPITYLNTRWRIIAIILRHLPIKLHTKT